MLRTLTLVGPAALVASLTASSSAITIQFDYSLDGPVQFFDTPQKRAVLEAAADVYEQLIHDRLLAIEPSGDDWWRVHIPNPSTGGLSMQFDMSIPEETLRVFVGGRDIPDDGLASVDAGAVFQGGSRQWQDTLGQRGQENALGMEATDVAPWGAAMAFDTIISSGEPRNWLFGIDADPGPDEYDFFSAALHEIPKVLGVGTADSWDAQVDWFNFTFNGSEAVSEFGGPVPLDASDPDNLTHWAEGALSISLETGETQTALNTRVLPVGTRKELTELDLAALVDLGWEIQRTRCTQLSVLMAGDADQDGDFDNLDLVQVLQRAKYLTGLPATWGDGDWNGAPGGCPGNPPQGNGLFDQLDIIAAIASMPHCSGPYDGGCYARAPTPVPEPAGLRLLIAGLFFCVVVPVAQRRRGAPSSAPTLEPPSALEVAKRPDTHWIRPPAGACLGFSRPRAGSPHRRHTMEAGKTSPRKTRTGASALETNVA